MNILILAAGFGTRMYPLTKDLPKALIKVEEKPVIEHILSEIDKLDEVKNIYILSNNRFYIHFLEWLDDFRKRDELSKKIKIINNGVNNEDEKKGALGDIGFSLPIISSKDNLLILASDDIFRYSLKELQAFSKEKNASSVAVKVLEREKIKKFGNVVLDKDGQVIYFEEKPQEPKSDIVATACYLVVKEDVSILGKAIEFESNKDKLGYVVKILMENSKIYGKSFDEFWEDISNLTKITELQ